MPKLMAQPVVFVDYIREMIDQLSKSPQAGPQLKEDHGKEEAHPNQVSSG